MTFVTMADKGSWWLGYICIFEARRYERFDGLSETEGV